MSKVQLAEISSLTIATYLAKIRAERSRARIYLLRLAVVLAGLGMHAVCATQAKADAVSVSYSTHQVSASTWQYQYSLTGGLSAGSDVAILFPVTTSTSLIDTSLPDSDFSTYVLQPDSLLLAGGELDLLASINNPNLLQNFSVEFMYTGAGAPGSQAFALYDSSFNLVGSGFTAPASAPAETPEPYSVFLTATGALAAWGTLRRKVGRLG